jgi:hypothetical protein
MNKVSNRNNPTKLIERLAWYGLCVFICLGFPLLPSAQGSCVEPPAGLVAWWPGDGHLLDIRGGHSLSPKDLSETYMSGMVKQSLQFTPTSTSSAYQTDPIISGWAEGTVDFWVNFDSLAHNDTLLGAGRASCNTYGFCDPINIFYDIDNNWGLTFFLFKPTPEPGGLHFVPSHVTAHDDEWYHIAVTWGSAGMKIYVDGDLKGSEPTYTLGVPPIDYLLFGNSGWGSKAFHGGMDEIEIFDRALSDAEIASIYNARGDGKCKPTCFTPPANLVGWWSGDDNPFDLVGGNDGTLMNGATYAAGKVGQAFSLDGVDDYVEIPLDTSLSPTHISVDAWFYATDIRKLYSYPPIVKTDAYALEINSDDGLLRFWVKVAEGWKSSSPLTVSTNTWYHAVGTYDGSLIKLYKDGQPTNVATSTSGDIQEASTTLNIGRDPLYPSRVFSGLIDEVEIFDRALTSNEILAIYNADSAGKCKPTCALQPTQMVAWWRGEDNAEDSIGIHDGTLVNGTDFDEGRVGRAFNFDGVDDAVHVGMIGNLGVAESGPLSIATWVNSYNLSRYLGDSQTIAGNYMGEQDGGTDGFSVYLGIYDSNLTFAINQRQLAGDSITTTISEGWRFVTATYDGTTLHLYLNGELKGSGARSFSGSAANTRGWDIGNFSPQTNASHGFESSFYGLIDEVQLFDRALSAKEIAAIYVAGYEGVCTPQITLYSVTANASGTGAGAISSNPTGISYSYPAANTSSADFDDGSNVTLTATANAGSSASWAGNCMADGGVEGGNGTIAATCTFNSLGGIKNATVTFTLGSYKVTANATGTGAGTVSSNPTGISYNFPASNSGNAAFNQGSTVILTGAANAGSAATWSGTCMAAGGTEGGNGTAKATCTFGNIGSAKNASVTFSLLNGPDITGQFQSVTLKRLITTYHLAGFLRVRNIGDRNAAAFKVAYYLSNDGTTLGTLLGTSTVRSLTTGASTNLAYGFFMGQSPKGKYLIAVIDSGNSVPEQNETNNRVAAKVP